MREPLRHGYSVRMHFRVQQQGAPQIERRSPMEGKTGFAGSAADENHIPNERADLMSKLGRGRVEEIPGFRQTAIGFPEFIRRNRSNADRSTWIVIELVQETVCDSGTEMFIRDRDPPHRFRSLRLELTQRVHY